jgi:hypothetical protein
MEQQPNKIQELKGMVRQQTMTYIMAAFGLVAGLAWNEAIKGLIEYLFPMGNSLLAKFIYAILITVLVVIISLSLLKTKPENK